MPLIGLRLASITLASATGTTLAVLLAARVNERVTSPHGDGATEMIDNCRSGAVFRPRRQLS
jgi:hypothetical protein